MTGSGMGPAGIGSGALAGIDSITITGGTVIATGAVNTQSGANIGQGGQVSGDGRGFTSLTHPANAAVPESATATFSVTAVMAGGQPTPSYQWQVSTDNGATWNNVIGGTGETTASYTTAAMTIAMSGYQYRCIISALDVNGDATGDITWYSNPATLKIGYPLTVNSNPAVGGTIAGASSGYYAALHPFANVRATANSGYSFTGWSISGTTFAGGVTTTTANPTSFEMPAGAVTLTANFKQNSSPPQSTAPSITSASGTTVMSGIASTFQVAASGTTPISYSLTGQPAGVSINASTGLITIAATTAVGNHPFIITADNGISPSYSQSFILIVQQPSSAPPVITSAKTATATSGVESTFKVIASGNAPLAYSLSGQPAGVTIDSATGVITIAATVAPGNHNFTITVTDSANKKTNMPFTLIVSPAKSESIQKAYIAFFNRPGDVPGMEYWLNYPGDIQDMLTEFSKSAEYLSDYAGLNNQWIISKVYQNLFGRLPELEGLNYWSAQMDAGWITIANVAYEILGGARNEDKTIIENKVKAANMFTNGLDTPVKVEAYNNAGPMGLPNAAKTWLAAVKEDNASVDSASEKLGALIQQLVERWEEFRQ